MPKGLRKGGNEIDVLTKSFHSRERKRLGRHFAFKGNKHFVGSVAVQFSTMHLDALEDTFAWLSSPP